jgi:hypothetical protein
MVEFLDASIGKGIKQLNRSRRNFAKIAAELPRIDGTKPVQYGLVVTLEPFYFNNNPFVRDFVHAAEYPVGVASSAEFESMMTLTASELELALAKAAADSTNNVLNIVDVTRAASGRENALIRETWDESDFFKRVETEAARLGVSAN